jgi:class 3 adenylate cyclase
VSQESSSTTYRCFLFADLRGYTAFIERAGNAAAVELLDDYLAITRRAVAEHHGAEIKTEGDGFHAVFPSASSAIMCGLDLVQLVEEANARHPERPIRVGIGIHAGEAVQTADGFVGSAVNIAARVCAAASAGEVLVTSTVRGITQTSIPVGFSGRGRRRLKGVVDRVDLFAVTRITEAERARAPRLTAVEGGVLVAALLAVAAVLILRPSGGTPGPSASPTPAGAGPALGIGTLEIGSHAADGFQPPFGLTISDPGWSAYRLGPEYVGLYFDGQPPGHVDIARLAEVNQNPCVAGGEDGPTTPTGQEPLDLIGALEGIPYLTVGAVEETTVGGHEGYMVFVDVNEGALAACGSFGDGDIAVFPVGDETWRGWPGERVRLKAVDVDGATVAVLISAESAASSSVNELEQFFERADRLLETISFELAGN